jgi:hypothetical protein
LAYRTVVVGYTYFWMARVVAVTAGVLAVVPGTKSADLACERSHTRNYWKLREVPRDDADQVRFATLPLTS